MGDEILGLVEAPLKHAEDVVSSWVKDPERAILGINNPLETTIWGKVLGKDYDPNVNMLGGATEAQKLDMEQSGINMGLARPAFKIADTVASLYGGQAAGAALASAAGAGGTAGGTLGEGVSGAEGAAGEAIGTSGGEVAAKTITGSAMGDSALKAGATAALNAVTAKAMAPKPPGLPAPIEMPDPLATEQARKKSLLEQMARRGRASTILTNPGAGRSKLGG